MPLFAQSYELYKNFYNGSQTLYSSIECHQLMDLRSKERYVIAETWDTCRRRSRRRRRFFASQNISGGDRSKNKTVGRFFNICRGSEVLAREEELEAGYLRGLGLVPHAKRTLWILSNQSESDTIVLFCNLATPINQCVVAKDTY